jgi:predicted regulator of Ras-like GTPase activity (Roadblock/LC7/MglB family)
MMTPIQSALGGLSDVGGVIGGFVLAGSGALVGTNLPGAFDASVFADAGSRIVRLLEASAAIGGTPQSCVFRFSEHKLYVRETGGTFLGVICSAQVNLPALKVAANLVARKVDTLVADEMRARENSAPAAPQELTLRPPAVDVPAQKPRKFYRGHPVD